MRNGGSDEQECAHPDSRASHLFAADPWGLVGTTGRPRAPHAHSRDALLSKIQYLRTRRFGEFSAVNRSPFDEFGAHTGDPHIPVKPASAPFQRHACTHAVVDFSFSGDITIDRIGDLGRGPRDFVAFGREEPRRQSVCAVRGISRSQLVLNRFARCLARHCLRWAVVGGSAGCSGRACAFISHAIITVFMNTTHHQRDFAH